MFTKSKYSLFRLLCIALAGSLIAGCSDGGGSNSVPSITKTAALIGAQQAPSSVTTAATGSGTLTVNPTTLAVSGSVTTTGLTGTAAHIHPGAIGVNGAPIVTLAETATGSGIWAVSANTVLSAANYALFQAGELYFNVHSAANPTGEIRGQISIQ